MKNMITFTTGLNINISIKNSFKDTISHNYAKIKVYSFDSAI